jgi:hypothetical protein
MTIIIYAKRPGKDMEAAPKFHSVMDNALNINIKYTGSTTEIIESINTDIAELLADCATSYMAFQGVNVYNNCLTFEFFSIKDHYILLQYANYAYDELLQREIRNVSDLIT